MNSPLISLIDLGHRFGTKLLYKGLTQDFLPSSSYAILGSNGTGKSTLLKTIARTLTPVKGSVEYQDKLNIPSFIAPYLNLYEDLTLIQHLKLLGYNNYKTESLEKWGLIEFADMPLESYSSGMKQRAKYVIAEYQSDNDVLILDEPHSNLDSQGIGLVQDSISELISRGKCVIIGSNDPSEYSQSKYQIDLSQYK